MTHVHYIEITATAVIHSTNGHTRLVKHDYLLTVSDQMSCTDAEHAFVAKANAMLGNLGRELDATTVAEVPPLPQ